MDVATTLSFFDRWFAHQKVTCGVTRLDVSMEPDPVGPAVSVKLTCPMCGDSIKGSIQVDDMPDVIVLLGDGKRH